MKSLKTVMSISFSAALVFCSAPARSQRGVQHTDHNTHYRAPHTMSGKMIILPIGTTFEGRISKTVSSARSHSGESFSLVLSAPVLANGIDVVIPAGSEVIGEVVEAVPSSSQPHERNAPKPRGKLRIQLNLLKTPDGTSFPLVCSLLGEQDDKFGRGSIQSHLSPGVGYVGTAEAFESVAPGANRYGKELRQGSSPEYVKKREFLSHEIYGTGGEQQNHLQNGRIRSLVLRKNDLWIDAGSPLTVKLQAPLRLSVTPNSTGAPVGSEVRDVGSDDSLPPPSLSGGDRMPAAESGSAPSAFRNSSGRQKFSGESAPPATPAASPPASPSAEF